MFSAARSKRLRVLRRPTRSRPPREHSAAEPRDLEYCGSSSCGGRDRRHRPRRSRLVRGQKRYRHLGPGMSLKTELRARHHRRACRAGGRDGSAAGLSRDETKCEQGTSPGVFSAHGDAPAVLRRRRLRHVAVTSPRHIAEELQTPVCSAPTSRRAGRRPSTDRHGLLRWSSGAGRASRAAPLRDIRLTDSCVADHPIGPRGRTTGAGIELPETGTPPRAPGARAHDEKAAGSSTVARVASCARGRPAATCVVSWAAPRRLREALELAAQGLRVKLLVPTPLPLRREVYPEFLPGPARAGVEQSHQGSSTACSAVPLRAAAVASMARTGATRSAAEVAGG